MKDESDSSFILPPSSFTRGPLFAVIPSVAIGGAIAVLAALFPAVFGGLMVVLKRWMTLLSVASINSTLYTLHLWLGATVSDKWWGSPWALWLTMLAITLVAAICSTIPRVSPGMWIRRMRWGTRWGFAPPGYFARPNVCSQCARPPCGGRQRLAKSLSRRRTSRCIAASASRNRGS